MKMLLVLLDQEPTNRLWKGGKAVTDEEKQVILGLTPRITKLNVANCDKKHLGGKKMINL